MTSFEPWTDRVSRAAAGIGFAWSGFLSIESFLARIGRDFSRFSTWIESGSHGTMSYLSRDPQKRKDPRKVFPDAKTFFCVARPYPANTSESRGSIKYARYLSGPDYHQIIARDLDSCLKSALPPSATFKICVDTSAVLERSWAQFAGLGWIGKNTMLIHPKNGSFFFIGEALISLELPSDLAPKPMSNFCGNCRACIDACPTAALDENGLDARKCISYWTLESKDPPGAGEPEKERFQNWIAGCDICQEVCPFNRKAMREAEPVTSGHLLTDKVLLMGESETEYAARVKGTALSRVRWERHRRNLGRLL